MSVPAGKSLEIATACGKKGLKYLVVITAGFKETGKEGLELERKLLEICRQYNMRMLAPTAWASWTPMHQSMRHLLPAFP